MYDICHISTACSKLSFPSKTLSRTLAGLFSAYVFSCAYRIERYKANNELPSVFQYGSFCRRICPNFTLNNFSCKRYVFNFLKSWFLLWEQRFFYKGLQRVGYFLFYLFSLLVNSFQTDMRLNFCPSWEIVMRRCPNEWQVLRAFFTKYRNRLFWKEKTTKPRCRLSNEPDEEQSILWVQYTGDSCLANNGTLRFISKEELT